LQRGLPKSITVDNGASITGRIATVRILNFIRPRRPVENGYIESFNGNMRDECLNAKAFFNLAGARRKLYLGGATRTTLVRTRRWTTAGRRSSPPPAPLSPRFACRR
jgi:transposase InsO family protein